MSENVTRFPAKAKARFVRCATTTIMETQFEPIRWIVPDYVPEGFSVCAGRQKLGKTWLALDWALAVATGAAAMGSIACEQGDVLYVDMENGPRRIQRRIDVLYPEGVKRPDLSRLEWVTDAPSLDKGFIDALEDWRVSVSNPRLVVVDVLQRIKPAGSAARTAYENDYSIWSPLQKWATEHGIAVVGLHHTKKGGAEDPLEALSGSNGLSACADTTLVLDKTSAGITLYVRGRDVEERETALSFNGGMWSMAGDAATVRRTVERSSILDALEGADEPMTPGEIAIACMMPRNSVDQLLFKMSKAGEILKAKRGRYIHPSRRDLIDDVTPDKIDKKIRNETTASDEAVETIVNQSVEPPAEVGADGPSTPVSYLLIDLIGGEANKKAVDDHPGKATVVPVVPNSRKHGANLLDRLAKPQGMTVEPSGEGYMFMRGGDAVKWVPTVERGRQWIKSIPDTSRPH